MRAESSPPLRGRRAIVVMTRIPLPGRTKTRMMPFLSPEECAHLHACFLEDLWLTCGQVDADLLVCHTDDGDAACARRAFGARAACFPQCDGTLGERMHHAAATVFSRGYGACVLLGVDSPELLASDVHAAFQVLRERDVVLGPTFDGGFYLIGLKKAHAELFSLPRYGQGNVLGSTVGLARAAGLSWGLTRPLHDLDTQDDLLRFIDRARQDERTGASRTARFLSQLLAGQPAAEPGRLACAR